MSKKTRCLILIMPFAWIASLWISYWSGFIKHLEISHYVYKDSQRIQLMQEKYTFKELNEGDVDGARKDLSEQITVDSSIANILDASVDEAGWPFMEIIYPREALTLIALYSKRESEKKARDKK